MTRTLKAFAVALMAVGALSAFAASGASAAGEQFHCEVAPCIITGTTQEGTKDTFEAGGGGFKVECVGHFIATQSTLTATTLTVNAFYTPLTCTSSAGTPTVSTNGCDYLFHSETVSGHIPSTINCTAGSAMTITVAGCTLSFGTQNPAGGIKPTNLGSGSTRDVTQDVTASNITFTKAGGIACLFVSGDVGTYKASVTAKCYEDLGTSGNFDETVTVTEGAQVGCWWQ